MAKPFPVIRVVLITDYMRLQFLVNTVNLKISKKTSVKRTKEYNLLKSQSILNPSRPVHFRKLY